MIIVQTIVDQLSEIFKSFDLLPILGKNGDFGLIFKC